MFKITTPPYMFYVCYIKKGRENYFGCTKDLVNRMAEHEKSTGQKCKLVYYEAYTSLKLARNREYKLKQFGGAWRSLKKRLEI